MSGKEESGGCAAFLFLVGFVFCTWYFWRVGGSLAEGMTPTGEAVSWHRFFVGQTFVAIGFSIIGIFFLAFVARWEEGEGTIVLMGPVGAAIVQFFIAGPAVPICWFLGWHN